MVKERIHWIDVSKGILILLLLLHHFASAKRVMGIDSNFFSFLTCWQSLYTAFFMQAFLMMSGYCSNFKKPHGQFWEGVIKQLVIPFIFFEFISCCIISAQKEDFSINGIFQVWIDTNGTTLWFLNALIVSKVLIYYMRRVTKSVKVALMITFVLLVGAYAMNEFDVGTNFFCIRQSLGSVFFVYLGVLLKERKEYFDRIIRLGNIYPYVLVLLLFFKLPIPSSTANMVSLKMVPLFIPLSICGSMAFFSLCKLINHSRFFEYFGRDSLIVYGVHFQLLCFSIHITLQHITVNSYLQGMIASVIIYTALIVACSFFIELFKRPPAKWFVGRF